MGICSTEGREQLSARRFEVADTSAVVITALLSHLQPGRTGARMMESEKRKEEEGEGGSERRRSLQK